MCGVGEGYVFEGDGAGGGREREVPQVLVRGVREG